MQQNSELREAHQKSLNEVKELKRFQGSTFDTVARRRLVEDEDTFLELTGKIQELQNEITCMNDSKDFQDAESVRSGNSHAASRPVSFSPHPIPEGLLRSSFVSPCRRYIGKRFCKSTCIFISSLSSRIESMEFVKRGSRFIFLQWEKSERPEKIKI